jgi:HEAT repeat protein/beta-lactamase regulating signal transducer with metallopeptidase domain
MTIFFNNPKWIEFATVILFKSLLLLALVLTFTWFLRRQSAAVRHFYLSVAAIVLLVIPLYTIFFPVWEFSLFPNPVKVNYIHGEDLSDPTSRTAINEIKEVSGATIESQVNKSRTSPTLWNIIFPVWILGMAGIVFRLIGGKIYCYYIYKKSLPVKDKELWEQIKQVSSKMDLKKRLEIMKSGLIKVPVIAGFIRPKLIMPQHSIHWPRHRIEAILFHELAHIKRNDVFVQFLGQIACALYWFNPLIWILERRLMIERERACDNMVILKDIKPSSYAKYLMEISEELGPNGKNTWVLAGMAEGTDFKDRMLSILDPNARRSSLSRARSSLTVVLLLLIVVPLVAFNPWTSYAGSPEHHSLYSVSDKGKIPDHKKEPSKHQEELEKLLSALSSASPSLREHAATALQNLGDVRAVPALIDALKDRNPDVREHVASALGNLGDLRAIEPLMKVIQNDPDAEVREHAASALGKLGDVRAVPALINALNDSSADVREHVASALGNLGDKRAYDQILDTFQNDESMQVREHAVFALAQLGDKRAYQQILEIITISKNNKLRAEAVAALGLTGDKRALPLLIDFLKDTVENIRLHAVHGLAYLGNKKALDDLKKLTNDPSKTVRQAVKMAIDKIRKQ